MPGTNFAGLVTTFLGIADDYNFFKDEHDDNEEHDCYNYYDDYYECCSELIYDDDD